MENPKSPKPKRGTQDAFLAEPSRMDNPRDAFPGIDAIIHRLISENPERGIIEIAAQARVLWRRGVRE